MPTNNTPKRVERHITWLLKCFEFLPASERISRGLTVNMQGRPGPVATLLCLIDQERQPKLISPERVIKKLKIWNSSNNTILFKFHQPVIQVLIK